MSRLFSIETSASLLKGALTLLALRAAGFLCVVVFHVAGAMCGAGFAWLVAPQGSDADVIFPVLGFATASAVTWAARGWGLTLFESGPLVAMARQLDGTPLSRGRAQIGEAAQGVRDRFGTAATLSTLAPLLSPVIVEIAGLVQGVAARLPLNGAKWARVFVIGLAARLLRSVALSQVMRDDGADNPWVGARVALVLLAQTARPVFGLSAKLALIGWLFMLACFLLLIAPIHGVLGTWALSLLFAGLIAWALHAALFEPVALSCLLQLAFALADKEAVNPDWEDKLDAASAPFRKLGMRAQGWPSNAARRAASASHPPGSNAGRFPSDG